MACLTLSRSRYWMLAGLMQLRGRYFSINDATQWDQRTFGSFLITTLSHDKWVEYIPGKGFHVTDAAVQDWKAYQDADITRADPSRPLTHYFDPADYGLDLKKKAKLHVIRKPASAA